MNVQEVQGLLLTWGEKLCIVQSMSYCPPIAFAWPVPWALFICLSLAPMMLCTWRMVFL
jgi:hypothetical protein